MTVNHHLGIPPVSSICSRYVELIVVCIASGGTLTSWRESYEKAAALVNKMSLVEKVNVTTGVGWQMGLCVGNTGMQSNLVSLIGRLIAFCSISSGYECQVPFLVLSRRTLRHPIR